MYCPPFAEKGTFQITMGPSVLSKPDLKHEETTKNNNLQYKEIYVNNLPINLIDDEVPSLVD